MKNWASQLNTLRFLAFLEVTLVVCAMVLPAWSRYLLPAAATIGVTLVGQLIFHSRSIEGLERPSDAEQIRLDLSR